MSLMIHNTLTNSKQLFVPVEPGKVKMYVCGVTVYDDIHMGHARSMIVFDLVSRYLRYLGYEVTHVTNFTDVDDKIIIKAAKEGVDPLELSRRYIERFFQDAALLGIERADIYPKASECIDDIIDMVRRIIDNGYAYVSGDGSVYFSVEKVKDYGRLSGRKLEDMESSGRIQSDEQKRNAMDFAVWKAAKPGECCWDSPWGKGRPGWHIECSAMIEKYLGGTIDIHGGGNDLIFPHHENEILQTEAATGGKLSNYWMHNGMLQVKGHGMSKEEKMSKSLGNFFTVKDVLRKFSTQTVRFYFLNTHYMSPLVYGEDMLEEAESALGRIVTNYGKLRECAASGPVGDAEADDVCDLIEGYRQAFRDAMDDDFNTREAIGVLFQIAKATNRSMASGTLSRRAAARHVALIDEINGVLNIIPETREKGPSDEVLRILIDLREELRKRKIYDLADMVRNRLGEAGIKLEDSSEKKASDDADPLMKKAELILGGPVKVPAGCELPVRISRTTSGPGAGLGTFAFSFGGCIVKKPLSYDEGEFELGRRGDGSFFLTRGGEPFLDSVVLEPVIRGSPKQAFFTLDPRCRYRCAFCNSPGLDESFNKDMSTERILEMIAESKEEHDFNVVSFTSGVRDSADKTVDRFAEAISAVKERYPEMLVGVEPYVQSEEQIRRLKDAGADEIKINLEAARKDIFEKVCPDLDYDSTLESLGAAVRVFGRGNVISNIIYGLGESDGDMRSTMERLGAMGVVPGIRALRVNALNRDRLEDAVGELAPVTPERMVRLARMQMSVMRKHHLEDAGNRTMCLLCGCCDPVPFKEVR